jgi:16S rRNA (uracil1498-N3)-methyltransferase
VRRALRVAISGLREGELVLDEACSRYVVRVHRLRPGQSFVGFDPEARSEADVTLFDGVKRARCRVARLRPATFVAPLPVALLQGLGKGDKAEEVLAAATALGARSVTFVDTEHSIPDLGPRLESRRARWRAVAVSAARQSGRGDVPAVSGPTALDEVLDGGGVVLVPGAKQPLLSSLGAWPEGPELRVLVGPEGGLSDAELERAERAGFRRVSLGPLVLRTELAASAVLGALAAWADLRPRP